MIENNNTSKEIDLDTDGIEETSFTLDNSNDADKHASEIKKEDVDLGYTDVSRVKIEKAEVKKEEPVDEIQVQETEAESKKEESKKDTH